MVNVFYCPSNVNSIQNFHKNIPPQYFNHFFAPTSMGVAKKMSRPNDKVETF